MTKLESLRAKIAEAVPDVMELKRGCFFKEHANPEIFVVYAEDSDDRFIGGYQKSGMHFGYNKKFALKNFEILGREITLADVLKALAWHNKTNNYLLSHGMNINYLVFVDINGKNSIWFLPETLSDQPQPTIDFLHSLLCPLEDK